MSELRSGVAGLLGIANENEFFSHYYLAEVFRGDTQETIAHWQALEDEHPGDAQYEAPYTRLGRLAREWFAVRDRVARERADAVRHRYERQLLSKIFEALGFELQPTRIPMAGWELPVLGAFGKPGEPPRLLIVHAWDPDKDGEDPLALTPHRLLWDGDPVPSALDGLLWQDVVSEYVFGSEQPPRWLILAGATQALLIDRAKWPQSRLLRFDWNEILDRREEATLKATAILLGRQSLLPDDGEPLLDALDENAHRHATAVSNDLKYTVREAVELLGNEAARQLIAQARQKKQAVFSEETGLDAEQLTLECLRYMYRLLFLFYVEARPELGYVPIRTSDTYQKGYSLEMLRDLELMPLVGEEARNGHFLDHSIRRIFGLIHAGYSGTAQGRLGEALHHSFSIAGLDSHLFDPDKTPLLNRVQVPNWIWQEVIQLMSLSRERAGIGRGRVSYAQLGINQLGAVYEALLSYRGFFARTDLYEVRKAGETPDELEAAHFVPADEIEAYTDAERVYDTDDAGRRKLRLYPKGKFIYRLAGRDREKSASYYTPEVLTKCLVKYALKELLRDKTADEILQLTVCEPAMGSAAFLNEAVNQLAQAYLDRKQEELGRRVPHDQYALELQRVKMYIADRNVFGVDLNPVAVELAEVSLWLNAISGSDRVPWFGYQLFSGNSLIGARREVYDPSLLRPRASPAWHECGPRRVNPQALDRRPEEIYHFLLPDPGMANYTDANAKQRYPEAFRKLRHWRRAFCKPLDSEEIANLQELSQLVDELWTIHTRELNQDRSRTEDDLPVWGQPAGDGRRTSTREKDRVRANGIFNEGSAVASAYRRLKLVMDYWCALWFWPLDQVEKLPTREQFWFEVGLLLRGNVVSTNAQGDLELNVSTQSMERTAERQESLPGMEHQSGINAQPDIRDLTDRFGQLHIEKLFENLPRLRAVYELSLSNRFFHWSLVFADVVMRRGGFDLVLGNPPWRAVAFNWADEIADIYPVASIRTLPEAESNELIEKSLNDPVASTAVINACTSTEATQRVLSSRVLYPITSVLKADLYKAFIEVAFGIQRARGTIGLVHQNSVFVEEGGDTPRERLFRHLRRHFSFVNQRKLFPIGNTREFSLNVYCDEDKERDVCFDAIFGLYHPRTIDACYSVGATTSQAMATKDKDGNWNLAGSPERVISITRQYFADVRSALDLPPVANSLVAFRTAGEVRLLTVAAMHRSESADDISSMIFEEGPPVGDYETGFRSIDQFVLQSAHITLGSLFGQTPKAVCDTHRAYDRLEIGDLPDCYLPRSNVVAPVSRVDLNTARVYLRRRLDKAGERTLLVAVGPQLATAEGVLEIAFARNAFAVAQAAMMMSLPYDYLVRIIGKPDFRENMYRRLPKVNLASPFANRMTLNALGLAATNAYMQHIWETLWWDASTQQAWAIMGDGQSMSPFESGYFERLTRSWHRQCGIYSAYARRQALVEIDVLAAMSLGMSLSDLLTIYTVQFPVFVQNEADTWYDRNGRIVFTISKGRSGTGLPRRASRSEEPCQIKYANGEHHVVRVGWEDIRDLSVGCTVTQTIEDDTAPGGPQMRQIMYVAPFKCCDREENYRTAWKVFEERLNH